MFLVASIFGGTGAAGFPTVCPATSCRNQAAGPRGPGQARGACCFPISPFPAPPADGESVIHPDSAAFMMQARGSTRVLFAAVPRRTHIRTPIRCRCRSAHSIAKLFGRWFGPGQPTLLPEMLAALAAIDFLQVRPGGDGETLVAGTSDAAAVGWGTCHSTQRVERRSAADVAATLRAALAWHTLYGPALADGAWQACRQEAWFRRMLPG